MTGLEFNAHNLSILTIKLLSKWKSIGTLSSPFIETNDPWDLRIHNLQQLKLKIDISIFLIF